MWRALIVVAAVAAVIIVPGLDNAGTDELEATSPEGWTTTVDRRRGFELSLPSGWEPSAESLTPDLTDPREILSAATFPLRYHSAACSHVAAGALEAIGRSDAFVTVQERGRDPGATWTEFRRRPARFADVAKPALTDVDGCVGGDHIVFWIPFTDAERHFYALVVLGREAPADVRAQAFEILDRLQFDPAVQPDWRSSG